MWKKVKKSLALFLALALMLSMVNSSELFVSAESTGTESAIPEESKLVEESAVPEEPTLVDEPEETVPEESAVESDAMVEEETAETSVEVVVQNPSDGVNAQAGEAVAEEPAADAEETVAEEPTADAEETVAEESTADPEEAAAAPEEETEEVPAEGTEEVPAEEEALTENPEETAEEVRMIEYMPEEQPEGVKVKAYAAEGVLPDGAVMTAAAIAEDEEAYQDAADALDESEVNYDGFVALDISFQDADGNKIEPQEGSIQVQFELDAALLPEEADTSTLEVQHLAEYEDGKINVQTVADTADAVDGIVEVKEDEAVVAVEFEVESFSSFTITWKDTGNSPKSVTVYYVDTDGKEIMANIDSLGLDENGNLNVSGTSSSETVITLADYDIGIEGYEYVGAKVGSVSGSAITQIRVNSYWSFSADDWQYYLQYKNTSNWRTLNSEKVYLIYEKT